jgi:putative endonuclease
MWFAYALHTSDRLRIYIGISQNPDERLKMHNLGRVVSTSAYRPWIRFYLEQLSDDAAQARKREKYLKGASGRRMLKKMITDK